MSKYYNIICPHCKMDTRNNKPNCSYCGLLLNKTSNCLCDYCKNKCMTVYTLIEKINIMREDIKRIDNKTCYYADTYNKAYHNELKTTLSKKRTELKKLLYTVVEVS